jgi:hypothetical protein
LAALRALAGVGVESRQLALRRARITQRDPVRPALDRDEPPSLIENDTEASRRHALAAALCRRIAPLDQHAVGRVPHRQSPAGRHRRETAAVGAEGEARERKSIAASHRSDRSSGPRVPHDQRFCVRSHGGAGTVAIQGERAHRGARVELAGHPDV